MWYVVKYIIGYENFLYADTDSAFYLSTPEIDKRLTEYNARIHTAAMEHGAYITLEDGTVKAYDKFDYDETENITEFVFLHAKAYSYIDNGKLKCVIAGVPDITDGVTREEELGSIENFKSSFVFRINGGTRAIYNESLPHKIIENGYEIELASSCLIEDTEKTLSDGLTKKELLYVNDGEEFDLF